MNWTVIQDRWRDIVVDAKQRWDKFSEQELHAIAGNRDALIQKLKDKYGMSHEEAEQEVKDFHESQTTTTEPQTRISGGGR
jgi:uncharacterized protein YjbJ (UPF0337 family)